MPRRRPESNPQTAADAAEQRNAAAAAVWLHCWRRSEAAGRQLVEAIELRDPAWVIRHSSHLEELSLLAFLATAEREGLNDLVALVEQQVGEAARRRRSLEPVAA